MTLGAFIEHRIRVLGIDQTILANRIGRPSSWVSRLINSDSERPPLRADLDALAQAHEFAYTFPVDAPKRMKDGFSCAERGPS